MLCVMKSLAWLEHVEPFCLYTSTINLCHILTTQSQVVHLTSSAGKEFESTRSHLFPRNNHKNPE